MSSALLPQAPGPGSVVRTERLSQAAVPAAPAARLTRLALPRPRDRAEWRRYLVRLALGLAAYALLIRSGHEQTTLPGVTTPAAAALSYALLARWGVGWWPLVFVGSLLVTYGLAPVAWVGVAAAGTVEALVGALLLLRLAGDRIVLDRVRDVVVLALPMALGASLVGGALGALALLAGGEIGGSEVLRTGEYWWLGDAEAAVALTPTLLILMRFRDAAVPKPFSRAGIELIAIVALNIAVTAWVFSGRFAFPYVLFPCLIWAALRFRAPGAALAVLGVTVVASSYTQGGTGPFATQSGTERLQGLGTFVAVATLTALLLGAIVSELDRSIQENKRLADALAANVSDLEVANRDLESFTYSVSHDLRAPLRNIDGFSRQLLKHHGDEVGERAQHYLDRIRINIGAMGTLIDELLMLSRLQRQRLHTRNVPMRSAVDAALEQLESSVAERQPELVVGELPLVRGDVSLLTQVYANLLSNALKYTRGREPARIEVGATRDAVADEWVFHVTDNGVGFDMKYADKLFGIFQRLHKAEEFEGSGVGLAIVARVVSRHGGRVWAHSQVGSGTTISFTLGDPDAGRA